MIWHVDLWRIDDPHDVLAFGLDEAMGQEICIIEWISKLGALLPPHGMIISVDGNRKSQGRKARFLVTSGYEEALESPSLSAAGLITE